MHALKWPINSARIVLGESLDLLDLDRARHVSGSDADGNGRLWRCAMKLALLTLRAIVVGTTKGKNRK